jgi:hypothetical protein
VLGEAEVLAHSTEDAADPTEIHAPQHGDERLAAGYSRLTGGSSPADGRFVTDQEESPCERRVSRG